MPTGHIPCSQDNSIAIPLEQGLRHHFVSLNDSNGIFYRYSIRTRIKTPDQPPWGSNTDSIAIPLEQGLRLFNSLRNHDCGFYSIVIPLEQGLRHRRTQSKQG